MSVLSSLFGSNNNYKPTKPVNTFKATSPVQAGTTAQGNTQAAGGAGPASGTIDRQNMLSDQLTQAANGQGPSPAQEMLKQATSANINTAAGQAASARGVNPALAMRTAVDSASQANQGAAGQAATLKANEQIAARQQLGTNLSATGSTQLGQQQTGANVLSTAGGLDLGAQSLDQRTQAQNASLDLGTQQLGAGIAGQNAGTAAGIAGGVMNGVGAAFSLAEGGEVPSDPVHAYLHQLHQPVQSFDLGGEAFNPEAQEGTPDTGAALSVAATPAAGPAAPGVAAHQQASKDFHSVTDAIAASGKAGMAAGDRLEGMHLAGTGSIYAHGGKVPARVSPGEVVVPPKAAHSPKKAAQLVAHGKNKVPGSAAVPGDSPANDTVHARLAPGSVVIPRSITQGPNAAQNAASFVQSVMKRGGKRYAVGGKVTSAPEALDLSEGGYVDGPSGNEKPSRGTSTARGVGGNTTSKRIKKASGGKAKYSDDLAPFPGE